MSRQRRCLPESVRASSVILLFALFDERRLDFVDLRDEHCAAQIVQVVEDGRRAGRISEIHELGQRDDLCLIDRLDRPLRIRIVGAQRLDVVADELDADRMLCAGRIEVDDPAAYREFAGRLQALPQRNARVCREDGRQNAQPPHGSLREDRRAPDHTGFGKFTT